MLLAQSSDRGLKVTLPDRADVSAALAIRESLLRAQMGSIDAVELDASRVVKLDVAALQLLLAWLKVLISVTCGLRKLQPLNLPCPAYPNTVRETETGSVSLSFQN